MQGTTTGDHTSNGRKVGDIRSRRRGGETHDRAGDRNRVIAQLPGRAGASTVNNMPVEVIEHGSSNFGREQSSWTRRIIGDKMASR